MSEIDAEKTLKFETEMQRVADMVKKMAARLVSKYPSPKQLLHRAAIYKTEELHGLAEDNLRLAERMAKDPRLEAIRQLKGHASARNDGAEIYYLNTLERAINGDFAGRLETS